MWSLQGVAIWGARSGRSVALRAFSSAADGFYSEIRAPGGAFKWHCDGEWIASTSGKTVSVINPCTKAKEFEVQACTQAEVDAAFTAARAAQRDWARTPLWRRAELLHRAAALLRQHAQPIADCLVAEIAKPSKQSLDEVVRSADLIDYTAEEGVRALGAGELLASDSFPGQSRNKLALVSKVPLGVVLAIPPFNYPVNLAASKLAPALMAGNAVVLKPPSQGVVAGAHLVQCFVKAGLPKGLLNMVTGKGSEIGDYLTQHPLVGCISFTGGDTGMAIARKAGMVPLQMELGGKDVAIVCSDADLDLAAKAVLKGGFSFSGQRCTAVKLVLVVKGVADVLAAKVAAGVAKLSVGAPQDDADITPVVSESSANFIEGLVEDARAKGAKFLTPYRRRATLNAEGNLIWPTLLDHVTPEMRIAWEEPFGPVVPIMRVDSVQQAIDHCNASSLALQGCVFTRDINQAIAISDAMETGTVQINAAPARGPDHFPFQGFRDSGIGSQGIRNSLATMVKTKSTVINLPLESYASG
ncbi:MAG: aldehyde dehydrogenase domain-containing protein [Monoraphidium minutum]|nr:MAG: aldehyde dehydrogenase domain-containing protein [Monoraphidium minutum]